MPTTDCAAELTPPDLQGERLSNDVASKRLRGTSKPLKGLLFGFAASVTIGLALASWYVGVRIVSADEVASLSPSAGRLKGTSASPHTSAASTSVEDSLAEAYWYMAPPAQLYLQIAGLGRNEDAGLVRSLESKGFRAQIQQRAGDQTSILIGPFTNHTELEQVKSKLLSAGVLAVETEY